MKALISFVGSGWTETGNISIAAKKYCEAYEGHWAISEEDVHSELQTASINPWEDGSTNEGN